MHSEHQNIQLYVILAYTIFILKTFDIVDICGLQKQIIC